MNRFLLAAALLVGAVPAAAELPIAATLPYPVVEMETSAGRIVLQLDRPRAPITVENFIRYVLDEQYDGTIFHRVIDGFVIQGGGYDAEYRERPTRDEIVNESGNGLSNVIGTIAMARHTEPHTATAQWYINVADNVRLDPSARRWGYTVFGRVIEGLEIIDRIAQVQTGPGGPFPSDVPVEPVVITAVRVIDPPETSTE